MDKMERFICILMGVYEQRHDDTEKFTNTLTKALMELEAEDEVKS